MGITEATTHGLTRVRTRVHDAWSAYLPYWLTAPMAIVLFSVTIFPFLYNVYLSLVQYSLTNPDEVGTFAGLSNFQTAFSNPTTWKAIEATIVFVGGALTLQTVLGFLLAVLLKDVTHRFKNVYRIILILPLGVAPVSLAIIGRIMLNAELGVIPYLIDAYTPFAAPTFLADPTLAMGTVILANTWQWTPFMFIIFYAGLTSVPEEPIEAARVDGAPTWRIYRHIIIPQMKPVILVAVLIRFIDLARSFGLVFTMTSGGPGNATRLYSIHVFETVFTYADLGLAGAMVLVYIIAILLLCNVYIISLGFKGVWD